MQYGEKHAEFTQCICVPKKINLFVDVYSCKALLVIELLYYTYKDTFSIVMMAHTQNLKYIFYNNL